MIYSVKSKLLLLFIVCGINSKGQIGPKLEYLFEHNMGGCPHGLMEERILLSDKEVALDFLIEKLEHNDPNYRRGALLYLLEMQDFEVINQYVAPMIEDENFTIKKMIVRALYQYPSKENNKRVYQLLSDENILKDYNFLNSILKTIEVYAFPESIKPLENSIGLLKTLDYGDKVISIKSIQLVLDKVRRFNKGEEERTQYLEELLLQDGNVWERGWAGIQIRKLNDPKYLPLLQQYSKKYDLEHKTYIIQLRKALGDKTLTEEQEKILREYEVQKRKVVEEKKNKINELELLSLEALKSRRKH